ncbi:MAG TPA: T9SS type A sorting domain-containing protein, partial [Prolixibacteraceae bacterium]|nr:T9SS type A sorting domain-containing protein [Prolixibacteraceae bacterium]
PISNVYYPVALAEKLSGKEINNNEADIICSFNKSYSWYFGTDGDTPVSQYDFVSTVLHEITHGLGVSGFLKDDGGTGFFNNNHNLPSIYDYHIFNSNNQQISDKTLFNSPSVDLHHQLTSKELKFSQPNEGENLTAEWLYAPNVWREGASIYHLEGTGYDYGLMTPFACKGEAIHDPGENTIEILSEMGWKSVTFDFEELKDIEEPSEDLPVHIALFSDFPIDSSTVKVVYSTDYFSSQKTAELSFDAAEKQFKGDIPIDFHQGNVQYYFELKSADNKTFNYPAQAPVKKLRFRIGPDYFAPNVIHNPVKMISRENPVLKLSAIATDNMGVNSVKIEYRINGQLKEPVNFENCEGNCYSAKVDLLGAMQGENKVEYRIIAEDNSSRINTKTIPSTGYYSVQVFSSEEAVSGYYNDFENGISDFVLSDFSISKVPGFSNSVLHTRHPYSVSAIDNEKYNLIAQLRYPVIIQQNGIMEFDEVVLVEPGEPEAHFEDMLFWDFVIVEGSKDGGNSWFPVTDGYDSGAEFNWSETFNSAVNTNTSVAVGSEDLALKQTIYLTENSNISAGDTVLFRFRLASDNSVNGWGWAIDNLEIQSVQTGSEEMVAEESVNVYPNPFTSRFYVDCSAISDITQAEVHVQNLQGKTIYQNSNINLGFDKKIQIDLANAAPGVYLVTVNDGFSTIANNKIVKH